ncbi:hypothetical protein M413DRAFT_446864 [Hebeloma cylindrosporum]|uniref:Uncharacterized protein n=1 Tax=Hebeloma cylindrosporum TaxID=76867 RepID=A0A0C3C8M9_HEBCY|nr:hypothetical protein M413DRAFT_446864 [Hebeloma cylindrosporum h7]
MCATHSIKGCQRKQADGSATCTQAQVVGRGVWGKGRTQGDAQSHFYQYHYQAYRGFVIKVS